MPVYEVEITEMLQKVERVEADNAEVAEAVVREKYSVEELVLDSECLISSEIRVRLREW